MQVHDFPSQALGKAIPYGVYDVGANEGWVSVGTDHDTAEFAVNAIGKAYDDVLSRAHGELDQTLVQNLDAIRELGQRGLKPQQAEQLAKRIRPKADTPLSESVDRAYQIALARQPTTKERDRMLTFIAQQQSIMGGEAAASTERALGEFCQVLLCLNEFLYVD